jgi:hypothetical protein
MPEDPAESSAALESTNPRNAGAKRKRGVGPTSRSVASLTAEQLEKKRKNDRDVSFVCLIHQFCINYFAPLLNWYVMPKAKIKVRLNEQYESEQKAILIVSMIGFGNWSKQTHISNFKELFDRKKLFRVKMTI